MREIKFRAWSYRNSDMAYPDEGFFFVEGVYSHFTIGANGEAMPASRDHDMTFESIVFQQYTGLKDANGVEIYEGDICVNTNGRLAKCIYHEPSASFDFVASYLTGLTRLLQMLNCGYSAQMSGKLIVIGNIYENPELLNKEIQND